MTFGRDGYGIEKACLVCESPTQSHPAPNGWFCHSCISTDPAGALEAISETVFDEIGANTTIECHWCDSEHTLDEAYAPHKEVIRAGIGYPCFDDYGGFVWVSCPNCLKATEYLTTEAVAETVAAEFDTPLAGYSRREGWSL